MASGGDPKKEKKAAKEKKGLRKYLRRLEQQLADATKAEARRVRKLEKARWRRQQLQASIDEARAVTAALPAAGKRTMKDARQESPASSVPAAAPEPRSAAAPKPAAKPAAARPAAKSAAAPKPAAKPAAARPAAKSAAAPKPAAKPAAAPKPVEPEA